MWEVIVSNVSEVFVRVLYRERFDHVCDGRGAGSNVGIPALNVSNASVCLLFVNAGVTSNWSTQTVVSIHGRCGFLSTSRGPLMGYPGFCYRETWHPHTRSSGFI